MNLITMTALLTSTLTTADASNLTLTMLPSPSPNAYLVNLPADQRARFRNPDGSCVQCSIAMCGQAANIPAAENLLWNTPYGTPIHGGSDPDRVTAYCNARHIPAYNITGPQTTTWIIWALSTGRPAAITWGPDHMVTAIGITDDHTQIAVCDNNSPTRITWVPLREFEAHHHTYRGGWAVILDTPRPAGVNSFAPWWN